MCAIRKSVDKEILDEPDCCGGTLKFGATEAKHYAMVKQLC